MRAMIVIPALLIAFWAFADEVPASSELRSLYDGRQWVELRKSLQTHTGSTLYRGVVAAVFNEDRRAERLLRSVIASSPRLGLTVRDSAGTLGTSTGASTNFRTAIVPE